ncbi:MAG: ribonuclease HI family protein [bacterium]
MRQLALFCDGGSRGNPGPAAYGWVLYPALGVVVDTTNEDIVLPKPIAHGSKYLGVTTNNQAEYQGLVAGLTAAKEHKATSVKVYLDSELIVKQLNLEYKVKDKGLGEWFIKAWNLTKELKATFTHVPRSLNSAADKLVNEALDTVKK